MPGLPPTLPDTPRPEVLQRLIRRCVSRGVPSADAEDIVFLAWQKAARAFDPRRGSFDALFAATVDNELRQWWRRTLRERKRDLAASEEPLQPATSAVARATAEQRQRELLLALEPAERDVFATWSLQRHLARGRFSAVDAARSLGLTVDQYNNAKRRLRTRVRQILDERGWTARDLYTVDDDERPRRD